jgi:hypothetical protein
MNQKGREQDEILPPYMPEVIPRKWHIFPKTGTVDIRAKQGRYEQDDP